MGDLKVSQMIDRNANVTKDTWLYVVGPNGKAQALSFFKGNYATAEDGDALNKSAIEALIASDPAFKMSDMASFGYVESSDSDAITENVWNNVPISSEGWNGITGCELVRLLPYDNIVGGTFNFATTITGQTSGATAQVANGFTAGELRVYNVQGGPFVNDEQIQSNEGVTADVNNATPDDIATGCNKGYSLWVQPGQYKIDCTTTVYCFDDVSPTLAKARFYDHSAFQRLIRGNNGRGGNAAAAAWVDTLYLRCNDRFVISLSPAEVGMQIWVDEPAFYGTNTGDGSDNLYANFNIMKGGN
jgi:hypothetical protein